MAAVIKKALELLVGAEQSASPKAGMFAKKKRLLKDLSDRELIALESEIGGRLFGPVQKGGRREFFNLDPKTWIWHEEWLDQTGKKQQATIRYEVDDKGILKISEGARYDYLEGDELNNLTIAIQMYYERVMREIYKRDPQTGQKLG
ncbi:hypothetical protein D3C73_15190 [compost metagenome]